jgi:hypothetical protein
MQTVAIPQNTPTLLAAAGNRDFCHIYNTSAVTIYVCYDGDAAAQTNATLIANGAQVVAGGVLMLNNTGPRNMFQNAIYATQSASASVNVQVHGGA